MDFLKKCRLFCTISVQISHITHWRLYKENRLEKSRCICPQSSKTVFMNTVKKSRLFPTFLCFEYRLRFLKIIRLISVSKCIQDPISTYLPNYKTICQPLLRSLFPFSISPIEAGAKATLLKKENQIFLIYKEI